ncbi:hypothetical protein [Saccharothrix sp. HUAS TT1]|uniref:hypothetical protein n=1 Tax=unclassified Saccharothrix TaxID=2593673 RepID=UPI00345BAD15
MFTHGGDAAETAITGSERRFHVSLLVDWNNNGEYDHVLSDLSAYVSSVSTDRDLRGSVPEELLLIEGSAAAELITTLSGEYNGHPFTAIFSPYNGFSPFYLKDVLGCEIKYSIGVETAIGTVWYQQFVGNIRTITPNRASSTVEITALDRVEKLRVPIQLPPWAVSDEHIAYGETDSQWVRSHWVVDHCLRLCDTSPTPYRPTTRQELVDEAFSEDPTMGVMFYLTGNGSYLPTIGYLDNPNAMSFPANTTPMFEESAPRNTQVASDTPRPMGLNGLGTPVSHAYGDPTKQGILRYWVADRNNIFANRLHFIGFTLNMNGPNASAVYSMPEHNLIEVEVGRYVRMTIQVNTGSLRIRCFDPNANSYTVWSPWVGIPSGQPNVNVRAQWHNIGGFTRAVRLQVGTNSSPFTSVAAISFGNDDDEIEGRVTIAHSVSMSDIYYGSILSGLFGLDPEIGVRPSKYAAVLDRGLNRFSHMPSHDVRDAWDVITGVASAEFGSVYWDEEGVFRFLNYESILDKQADIVRTITLDQASNIEITNTLDSVRNIYTVQARRKRALPVGPMFQSGDANEFICAPSNFTRFRIWRDDVLSPLTFLLQRYSTAVGHPWPTWDDNASHGYVVQWLVDGVWAERYVGFNFTDSFKVNAYFTGEGYLEVEVWNSYAYPARFATDSGSAAMRFQGTRIVDDGTTHEYTRNEESIALYGPRNLPLEGEWYQDTFSSTQMLETLKKRTGSPSPVTDAIAIAGDPRLQLGDTVKILDAGGLGEESTVQIYGIRRFFDLSTGLTDTLTVEMIRPPGIGLWNSPQYGRWDQTFIWSE